MKQQITGNQWSSLSDPAKDKQLGWIAWSKERNTKGLYHACMSIGVMIEFLYQHETVTIESEDRESPNQGWLVNKKHSAIELCDALWKAVVEELEKP